MLLYVDFTQQTLSPLVGGSIGRSNFSCACVCVWFAITLIDGRIKVYLTFRTKSAPPAGSVPLIRIITAWGQGREHSS